MFYVCNKRGNKYGVVDTCDGICEYYSKDDLLKISESTPIIGVFDSKIKVVGTDFVKAKMKLLGIKDENTNYLKWVSNYITAWIDGENLIFVDKDTNSQIIVPKTSFFKHKDLFIGNSKLKICDLVNNRYFEKEYFSLTSVITCYVYFNYNFMMLDSFVVFIRSTIQDLVDDIAKVHYLYRISVSKLIVESNCGFYIVDLLDSRRLLRKIKDETAKKMISGHNVMTLKNDYY